MLLIDKLLIAEVFVLVALTFGLLLRLGQVRVPMVMKGEVRMKDIALSRDGWPSHAIQLANAFDNQLQLPVLFYVAVGLGIATRTPGWLEVILGALFVASRLAHAFIHVTDNNVPRRFAAYAAGFSVLAVYWAVLGVRVVLA